MVGRQIRVPEDVKKELDELIRKLNMKTYGEVIRYLIDVYKGVDKGVNRGVDNNNKLSTDMSTKMSTSNNVVDKSNTTMSTDNKIVDRKVNQLSTDEYLDNRDFQEMIDEIKTAIDNNKKDIIEEILREFLDGKVLTIQQYDKLVKQYSFIKEMLVFNGKGYTVP